LTLKGSAAAEVNKAACSIERVGGVIQIAGSRGWHMALVYGGIHQRV
jgi:hypothetical protein